MQHKYIIVYTFKTENNDYGHGKMQIKTDKKIEHNEDLMEISRDISRRHNGVTTVAINTVTEMDE